MNYEDAVEHVLNTLRTMYPEMTFEKTIRPSRNRKMGPLTAINTRTYTLSDDLRDVRRWDEEQWKTLVFIDEETYNDVAKMELNAAHEVLRYANDTLYMLFFRQTICVTEGDEYTPFEFKWKPLPKDD